MEYLRSLLPLGYPPAPPSSLRTASPIGRDSDCTSCDHLSPPSSVYDETDPPPFLPNQEDHTSLNQMEMDTSSNIVELSLSMYARARTCTRSSADTSSERPSFRPRSYPSSHPTSPPAEHAVLHSQLPQRRSSMPASALRRPDKCLTAPHDAPPCVRFTLDPEVVPQEEVPDALPSSLENITVATDASSHFENFDATLTPDDPVSTTGQFESLERNGYFDDDEPGAAARIFQTDPSDGAATKEVVLPQLTRADTDPGLQVPREIRLIHPTTARRRSLPDSVKNKPLCRLLNQAPKSSAFRVLLPKGSAAGSAITHAYVHTFLLGEAGNNVLSSAEDTQWRLSATREIVQSKDSTYEVIWEDTLSSPKMASDAEIFGSNASSVSPDGSAPVTPTPITEDVESLDPDCRNIKLAAWSWTSKKDEINSQSQLVALDQKDATYSSVSVSPYVSGIRLEDKHSATPRVPFSAVEDSSESAVAPPWVVGMTMKEEDDGGIDLSVSNQNPQNGSVTISTSHPMVLAHEPLPQSPPRSPSSNAQRRRELMGNRKISNIPPEDESFAYHRDSLVLAHMRIFHDNPDKEHGNLNTSYTLNPYFEQLKRTTWTRKRAESAPYRPGETGDTTITGSE